MVVPTLEILRHSLRLPDQFCVSFADSFLRLGTRVVVCESSSFSRARMKQMELDGPPHICDCLTCF